MTFITRAAQRLHKYILNHPYEVVIYVVTLALFLVNARYVDYPDEYVNVLAGRAILHGALPYRDVWDHHLPGAWYLASVLIFAAGGSFVRFRILWALGEFVGLAILTRWVRRTLPELGRYMLFFMFVYPMAALYFWFHLYLADSLAVFFFSLSFWIIIVATLKKHISVWSIYIASLLIFFMIFSSTTYLYMGAAMYMWLAYIVVLNFHVAHNKRNNRHVGHRMVDLMQLIGVSVAPYIIYLFIVVATGTWSDFYFANFVYNTTLYIDIPNYVRGSHFNPIKFALTIMANFYDGYLPLLSKIKHLDLYLPIGTLAGISTLTLLLTWLEYSLPVGALYFCVLSFSAPRSNIQNYKETDYQSSMFLVLGLASAMIVLYMLRIIEGRGIYSDIKRIFRGVTGIFLVFTVVFLSVNSFSKTYQLYTQKLPSIHNRGEVSEVIDQLVGVEDYYFIGPYEPNEAFYVQNGHFPGKYVSLLPQFRESDHIRRDFIREFEAHPPKVIIFKQQASIFGTPAVVFGKFLYDWMGTRYTSIEHIPGVTLLRNPTGFDLKTDLYLRNEDIPQLLERLQTIGYISM